MMLLEQCTTQLLATPPAGSQVHASLTLPLVRAPETDFPADFPAWFTTMLRAQGIEHLAAFQAQALQHWRQGQHVWVAAPGGGGRGVGRLLVLYDTLAPPQRGHALLLFPHKERELVQLARINAWNAQLPPEYRLTAAIYDGDTPPATRRTIKQSPPHLLLTTPEMLHAGILAYHAGWRTFFQDLRAVVLVDAHDCDGALGAHLTHLLQRLQRLAQHYGALPRFLVTSAPLAYMQSLAQTLLGQPCTVVAGDAYCSFRHSRLLLEVPGNAAAVVHELVERLGAVEATPLIVTAAEGGRQGRPGEAVRSIIFQGVPSSLTHLHESLALLSSNHAYSLGILVVSGATPLERYFLRYPAVFQSRWLQHLACDPGNTLVVRRHQQCAAAELALKAGEPYARIDGLEPPGNAPAAPHTGTEHTATGTRTPQPPHRGMRLRVYEPGLAVLSQPHEQLLTTLPPAWAFRHCFTGAIYPYDGQAFHVERVLSERRRILVRPIRTTYHSRGLVQTEITAPQLEAAISDAMFCLTYGTLTYTATLHAYERLDPRTGLRTSVQALPEQRRQIRTRGVWMHFPADIAPTHPALQTAVHTLVHATLAVFPLLFASPTLRLRGGVYGAEAVFVDEDAGGNGASAGFYHIYERVLRAALQLLLQCDCDQGCSRCIAALSCDTCGSAAGLERQAGIALLQHLLAEAVPALEEVRLPGLDTTETPPHLYLCLTTQRSAEDVGGWQHKHRLGLGVAVTYNAQDGRYRVYTAETVVALLDSLRQAQLVIGFNPADFDYQVLQPYTTIPLTTLPTLAILQDVQQGLGFRVSLSHLVRETLGLERPDDSIQTLHWLAQGAYERIVAHCRRDLDLLRALLHYGSSTGNLWYSDQAGARQSFPVPWRDVEAHG